MKREDVIRMAQEAGYMEVDPSRDPFDLLARFAALVEQNTIRTRLMDEIGEAIAREREECAKMCDGWLHVNGDQCAEAIRGRGQS